MEERSNNTLTANELRNDEDAMSGNATFIEGAIAPDERTVIRRTSRSITRRKLSIFISVAVAVLVIILVILIPVLGVRKNA